MVNISMREKLSRVLYSSNTGSSMVFTQMDIENSTESFSSELLIGKGGFGTLYRGIQRCTDVAVKVLSKVSVA